MENIIKNVKKIKLLDILIFSIPVISWLLILCIYFPGFMTYDSFVQWNQIVSHEFNNVHPFFHTFLEFLLTRIWYSPAIVGIFQILVFSIIWTSICKYTRKSESIYLKVFQIVFTLFIAVVPLNAIHSITLWKDILYSYSIMLMTFLMLIGIDKKFKYSKKDYLFNGIAIASIMLLRHNGKLVGLLILLVITFLIILNNKSGKIYKKLLNIRNYYLAILVFVLFFTAQIPKLIYKYDNGSLSIDYKLLHIIAAFNYENKLSDRDLEEIKHYVDLERLKELYNPYYLDPIMNAVKSNLILEGLEPVEATEKIIHLSEVRIDMSNMILRNSIKHPDIILKYLKDSTAIMWSITKPSKANDKVYGTIIDLNDYSKLPNNIYGIKMKNIGTEIYNKYNNIVLKTTYGNQFLTIILNSPALYFYVSIIFTIIIVRYTKNRYYYLLILPNIINLVSLVMSIPLEDVRYVYSNFLVAYITIIVFVSIFINSRNNKKMKEFKMSLTSLKKTYYDMQDLFFPRNSRRRRFMKFIYRLPKNLTRNNIGILKIDIKTLGLFKALKQFYIRITEAPRVINFHNDYISWMKNNEPGSDELKLQREYEFEFKPKISIVVPMYNTPKEFFIELISSVKNQTYSNWELCLADGSSSKQEYIDEAIGNDARIKYSLLEKNSGISINTNEALKLATGDYIGLLDHDDLLSEFALFEVVQAINSNEKVDFIYSDEDKINLNGKDRYDPHFKPDFSPDLLRSYNYICHFSVFKKELMQKLEGFRSDYDGAQDYDIILRATENSNLIVHIPKILYHWRVHPNSTACTSNAKLYAYESGKKAIEDHLKRLNINGSVEHEFSLGLYRVRYAIIGNPKISIIIANKDEKDSLKKCINSILKSTYKNYEIIIVENNSKNDSTFKYYESLKKQKNIKVIRYEISEFNYSKINNFGVKNSTGEYILLLNNDIEVITPTWLEEMLSICQREDVGIVGSKLLYPDNTVQHAGVVVGMGGIAGHINKLIPTDDIGYYARASIINNYSAVTAACLLVKRKLFNEVKGLDEEFKVAFNDVDFCMKIRSINKLVVYTPYAQLYHYESKSRGYEDTEEKQLRFKSEADLFEKKWGNIIKKGDPYFNINFRLDVPIYRVNGKKI